MHSQGEYAISVPASASGRFSDAGHQGGSVPPIISILVGEAVYNFRAALDYLVYQLAILDSGKPQEYTQFPIEHRPKEWPKTRDRYLKGILSKHQAAISRLQPFNGCVWIGRLKNISNPDKHMDFRLPFVGLSIPHNRSTVSKTIRSISNKAMRVKGDIPIQVLLDDWPPVVETLQVFQTEITSVLDTFKPEFK